MMPSRWSMLPPKIWQPSHTPAIATTSPPGFTAAPPLLRDLVEELRVEQRLDSGGSGRAALVADVGAHERPDHQPEDEAAAGRRRLHAGQRVPDGGPAAAVVALVLGVALVLVGVRGRVPVVLEPLAV